VITKESQNSWDLPVLFNQAWPAKRIITIIMPYPMNELPMIYRTRQGKPVSDPHSLRKGKIGRKESDDLQNALGIALGDPLGKTPSYQPPLSSIAHLSTTAAPVPAYKREKGKKRGINSRSNPPKQHLRPRHHRHHLPNDAMQANQMPPSNTMPPLLQVQPQIDPQANLQSQHAHQ